MLNLLQSNRDMNHNQPHRDLEPNIIDLGVVDFKDEIDEEFGGKIWKCF